LDIVRAGLVGVKPGRRKTGPNRVLSDGSWVGSGPGFRPGYRRSAFERVQQTGTRFGLVSLQVRTQVLNDDLRRIFERWYPGLKADTAPTQEVAA
jgi:hypothetical protein